MERIIQRYLNARHWQIFLLLFALPFVLYLFLMVGMVISMQRTFLNDEFTEPDQVFSIFSYLFLFMLSFLALMNGWFWSISKGLLAHIPAHARKSLSAFRIFLLIPLFYVFLLFLLFGMGLDNFNPGLLVLIIPLHFLTIFGTFYNLYFVSRTVKAAELQRPVTFGDYAGEFFLLWFYPVGIWFIQPKVNDIVQGKYNSREKQVISASDLLDD